MGEQIKSLTEKILSHDEFMRFLEEKTEKSGTKLG